MDTLTLLKELATAADTQIMAVMKPVTPEQGAWKLPNSKANTITSTFLHAYSGCDNLIAILMGQPSLMEQRWKERIPLPREWWTFEARPETDLLLAYAGDVTVVVNAYLDDVQHETLDDLSETPRGPRTIGSRLSTLLVTHKFQHTGDISSLLGCQGLQGLP